MLWRALQVKTGCITKLKCVSDVAEVYWCQLSNQGGGVSSSSLDTSRELTFDIRRSIASAIPAAACLFSLASIVSVFMMALELTVKSCSSVTYWLTNAAVGSETAIWRVGACEKGWLGVVQRKFRVLHFVNIISSLISRLDSATAGCEPLIEA